MKITDNYFSYPPHLVVSWDQISSIQSEYVDDKSLNILVNMKTTHQVALIKVDLAVAEAVFAGYQNFLERASALLKSSRHSSSETLAIAVPLSGMPLSLFRDIFQKLSSDAKAFNGSHTSNDLEQLTRNLHHDPQMSTMPMLPEPILSKIAHTARMIFSSEDAHDIPQPQPGCHCIYCQIARAIQGGLEQGVELVRDDELLFCPWQIQALSSHHFLVISDSDPDTIHEVYLKPNVRCSCLKKGCEHIAAVLRS